MSIKTLIKNINKKEWLFLIFIAILVILATTLPYIYGYLTVPKDAHFLGVSGLNKVDYFNYFSYIEQVKQGHLLFEDYYTTEPQPRIIFNLFFLSLGLLAKIFHFSAVAIFQIVRIILIPVFIFIFYLFVSFLFREKSASRGKQKLCLVLVCFSSGLGYVLFSFIKNFSSWQQPMDLWIPEAITFLTFYTNPLFIFSLTLIVSIFFLMLLALENKNYKYAVFAGLTGLILFQIHPYHFPTIFFVLGAFWLALFFQEKKINWMFFKYGLIFFVISLPSLLYYAWMSSSHWLTIQRINQAAPVGFTPPFMPFLISYGFLWLFVIIGIYFLVKNPERSAGWRTASWRTCGTGKKMNHLSLFLITWLPAQIALIYLPLPLQRRMSEGLHLVICILAAWGLFVLYQKISAFGGEQKKFFLLENKFLWIVLFIFLFTCSNIFIISQDLLFFGHPGISLSQEIIESMTWLKNNSPENSNILSVTDLDINNLVPALAVRKVYVGHGSETAYFDRKIKEISWFFETNDYDQKKQDFLKENNLNYVLVYEKNHIFQPEEKEYLKKVFENSLVGVYRVL